PALGGRAGRRLPEATLPARRRFGAAVHRRDVAPAPDAAAPRHPDPARPVHHSFPAEPARARPGPRALAPLARFSRLRDRGDGPRFGTAVEPPAAHHAPAAGARTDPFRLARGVLRLAP